MSGCQDRDRGDDAGRGRLRATGDRLALALLVAGAAGGWLAATHGLEMSARGITEIADAGVIVVCTRRAAVARREGGSRFWGLLTIALGLLAAGYCATALSRWLPTEILGPAGVAAVLGAYPFLMAALCVRAVHEEGFKSGLATFCDVGMLVVALLAACLPVVIDSLGRLGTADAAASGLTWAGNVGLFAGGLWLLYRLPGHRRTGGVVLMVVALGLFSLVSLVEIVGEARGWSLGWQVGVGYGVCYALLARAPRSDARPGRAADAAQSTTSWRAVMPYVALCPLIGLWCMSALEGGDAPGAVRRDHRRRAARPDPADPAAARAPHRAPGPAVCGCASSALMQEVARTLAATLELDDVVAEVVRAPLVDAVAARRGRLRGDAAPGRGRHPVSGRPARPGGAGPPSPGRVPARRPPAVRAGGRRPVA